MLFNRQNVPSIDKMSQKQIGERFFQYGDSAQWQRDYGSSTGLAVWAEMVRTQVWICSSVGNSDGR